MKECPGDKHSLNKHNKKHIQYAEFTRFKLGLSWNCKKISHLTLDLHMVRYMARYGVVGGGTHSSPGYPFILPPKVIYLFWTGKCDLYSGLHVPLIRHTVFGCGSCKCERRQVVDRRTNGVDPFVRKCVKPADAICTSSLHTNIEELVQLLCSTHILCIQLLFASKLADT